MLFSATFSDEIRRLASEFLTNPAIVEVARRNTAAEIVEQVLYPVDRDRKEELLLYLIRRDHMAPGPRLHPHQAGRQPAGLVPRPAGRGGRRHPQRSKPARADPGPRGLQDRRGDLLVATDVASRGLDIEELPYVVNFELPFEPQDYIHRIGRTGRAGATGIAISLVCMDEVELLKGVQRLLKRQIPYRVVEGFVPDRSVEVRPLRGFGPGGRAGSGNGRSDGFRGRRRHSRARPRPPQAAPRTDRRLTLGLLDQLVRAIEPTSPGFAVPTGRPVTAELTGSAGYTGNLALGS